MLRKSPSGALSPYYYKGGYFHGIHYGSYFQDADALLEMMKKEEEFILKSTEKRRILIDLYETEMSPKVVEEFVKHLVHLNSNIIKLAIATDKRNLKIIRRGIKNCKQLNCLFCYYCTDMEEGKTWLISDQQ